MHLILRISWRKDNAQKVYSQANAQERSAATLYDLANRESTLRGAQATYPNKENRKNRTNLQPRRYAQQAKEAAAQIYARASARGRREGGGAHHGCGLGVGRLLFGAACCCSSSFSFRAAAAGMPRVGERRGCEGIYTAWG